MLTEYSSWMRKGNGNARKSPFVAGELGEYLENYKSKKVKKLEWQTINSQLHGLEGRIGSYCVVSSAGLSPKRDKLHFDTESLRKFGVRYAEALIKLQDSNRCF